MTWPTMSRPEWIIFDAADTLLRPEPSVAEVYKCVAERYGVVVSVDAIKARFQPAIRIHFADAVSNEQLDRARWQQLVYEVLETDDARVFDDLWQHFAEPGSWRLFDDVASTWSWLVEQGFRIGIGSNFDARLLNIVAAMPPLAGAEQVFVSSKLGFRKPATEFFRAIEQQLGVEPDQLMLVGDSRHADFEGAVRAGWSAVWLDRSAGGSSQTAESSDAISSLAELKVLLC